MDKCHYVLQNYLIYWKVIHTDARQRVGEKVDMVP
jgi:hypothetical protein